MSEQRIEPQAGAAGAGDAPVDRGAVQPEIVSVNSKNVGQSRVGKTLFILVCAAVLVGILGYLGQSYLNAWKQSAKPGKRDSGDELNPEGSRLTVNKVGAATGKPPPQIATEPAPKPGPSENDGVRAIRGADGKVMTDPQGRALGVDNAGKVVPVPAIATLPAATPVAQAPAGPPPPSRYGGSLFVEKAILKAAADNAASAGAAAAAPARTPQQEQLDLLRALIPGAKPSAAPAAVPAARPPVGVSPYSGEGAAPIPAGNASGADRLGSNSAGPGMTTVASTQVNTRTPVVQARLFPDQNLMLPKGRQAGCVLTTRIDDQLPGYTSCVLSDDLFSDNGKTLLLEHGSEIWGEYGTMGQAGLTRIAVNWVRIKTRDGITVDLSSPGTDALGGSGLPGHYNPRWPERIGAAVLLSLVKDVTTAIINNQSKGSGTTVSVAPPGQNTIGGSSNIADQVVRETLRVRPNVTIAEGTRISIYVARDLDFRPVYELRHAAKLARATPQ